jgi:hypothetical protein
MVAKPNSNLDERVTIPLDPETALRELLKVDLDSEPANESEPSERGPEEENRHSR